MNILFCLQYAVGQEIHLSQFYASPLLINAGETGFVDANWRFAYNFRNQWAAIGNPYQTMAASFDKPFNCNDKTKIGLGLFVANDKSGALFLNYTKASLAASFIRKIKKIHNISIGIQLGYVIKNFSTSGMTLPSQFDSNSGLFNEELPNNLQNLVTKTNYFDFNAGCSYNVLINKNILFIGLAFQHINTPRDAFLQNNAKIGLKKSLNIGLNMFLKERLLLKPELYFAETKRATSSIFGSLIYYNCNNKIFNNVFAGVHARYSLSNFDAFILTLGTKIYGVDLGLNYDINISSLRMATKMRGAFELSIIYKDISKTVKKIALPCDRY